MADDAIDQLASGVGSSSFPIDVPADTSVSATEAGAAQLPPEIITAFLEYLAVIHEEDEADQNVHRGHGARDVLAVRSTCKAWRAATERADLPWYRVIQARYPRLDIGYMQLPGRLHRRRRLSWHDHYRLHADVVKLRDAPAATPPPPRPLAGASLEDFTFTIESTVVEWEDLDDELLSPSMTRNEVDLHYSLERERERFPIGSTESWTGVLTRESFGNNYPRGDSPLLGSLQIEEATVRVSVYVTTPELHTFKLYCEGAIEGSDDDCGDIYSYFATQPLPYAPWQSDGLQPTISLNEYTGSVALRLLVDDDLDEDGIVAYLCGAAIP
jgi:hypothetical protein